MTKFIEVHELLEDGERVPRMLNISQIVDIRPQEVGSSVRMPHTWIYVQEGYKALRESLEPAPVISSLK